ncbi:MAG: DUF1549 domain-containing protein [Deltaproteobacteria bacterium]
MVSRILLGVLAAGVVIAGEGVARAQAAGQTNSAEAKEPADAKARGEKHPSDQLATWIDARFEELWKEAGVEQKEVVDDGTFLRRVYLDLVGTIPSVAATRDFLSDSRPDKRYRAVDQLIGESRSAAHLSRVWRRIMVPQGSPGMGAAPQLEVWLQQQFAARVPYDKLARELVTAKPSPTPMQFAAPTASRSGAPSAFYFAVGNTPDNAASSLSRVFLGVRIGCAKCHNHPFADWRQDDFWGMAAFFAGASILQPNAQQATDSKVGKIKPMESDKEYPVRFLWSAEPAQIPADKFPRDLLADWLASKENRNFAATAVNRVWQQLCGQGLIPHVDDLDQAAPKERAVVLDDLARQFADADFDVQWLIQGICKSRVYQRLCATADNPAEASPLSTYRPLKTLSPEQVFDSLCQALMLPVGKVDQGDQYNTLRNTLIGRLYEAASDAPDKFNAGIPQALIIMNGIMVARGTDLDESRTLRAVVDAPFLEPQGKIETLYLAALTRKPEARELERMLEHVATRTEKEARRNAYVDIYWALLNSPEFVLSR